MIDGAKDNAEKVDLDQFASMVGFPVELIKKELFESAEAETDEITMDQLRAVMLKYLDKTMA